MADDEQQSDDPDPLRDTALRAAQGDRPALERLLGESFDLVYSVCHRMFQQREDALDVTQDALIAVTRGIASFDGRSRYTTWLYRVATNAALMELRKRRRRPVLDGPPTIDPAAGATGPESQVMAASEAAQVLAGLPEEYRIVLVLREIEDLEYGEIAEILDVPVGTVRSRLNRARAAALQILGNSSE